MGEIALLYAFFGFYFSLGTYGNGGSRSAALGLALPS